MNDIKGTDYLTKPPYARTPGNWCIDLRSFAGVTLSDVQKDYIGFGERGNTTTPGGPGTVVIDEIKLLPAFASKAAILPPGDVDVEK